MSQPGAVREAARAARAAAARLARTSGDERDCALAEMAEALQRRRGEIVAANRADLERTSAEVAAGRLPRPLLQRLSLDDGKLDDLLAGLEQVRALPDPLGRVALETELDGGLVLRRVTCPIGVVCVIFESRPEVMVQIAGLAIKSGNALLLKGGSEAECSNRALHAALALALEASAMPAAALTLLESREDVAEVLGAREDVDLIVPRGSNALVRAIQGATTIPVLGHAEGICHVYVDRAADLEQALAIVLDAKVQYPAACNAVETVLVHAAVADRFLPPLAAALAERGVELRADPRGRRAAGGAGLAASEQDWRTEYGDLIVALRVVDDLDGALEHIRRYGSRHTEAIVTRDDATWRRFAAEVDAAGVFRDVSTRFADGFRYGFGAEVGISTGKLHPRGPVGIEGLVTYKYQLEGHGQLVADYAGEDARRFTHRRIV